jgi:hypothetical protein
VKLGIELSTLMDEPSEPFEGVEGLIKAVRGRLALWRNARPRKPGDAYLRASVVQDDGSFYPSFFGWVRCRGTSQDVCWSCRDDAPALEEDDFVIRLGSGWERHASRVYGACLWSVLPYIDDPLVRLIVETDARC